MCACDRVCVCVCVCVLRLSRCGCCAHLGLVLPPLCMRSEKPHLLALLHAWALLGAQLVRSRHHVEARALAKLDDVADAHGRIDLSLEALLVQEGPVRGGVVVDKHVAGPELILTIQSR